MFSINVVILVCILFVVLYAPRAFAWFGSLRPQKRLHNEKKNRLALFVPARNEGKNVIPLFESIKAQTYDPEYFDTFVVVKDPEDEVYEYAKICGAEVFCDMTQNCKGDCTDYTFKQILAKYPGKYDGYIIVDADCLLENTFLEEMNNAMASGADIINSKKRVKNYYHNGGKDSNLVTCCNGLIWTLMDDMGNRFKSDHGIKTMTVTTGILLSKRVVENMQGWGYKQTLTEDMELARDAIIQDYKCFYYSHALIYMEEATTLEETNKRRNRWMHGLIHSDYIYFNDMLKNKHRKAFSNLYYTLSLWIVYLFDATLLSIAAINLVSSVYKYVTSGLIARGYIFSAVTAVFAIYLSYFVMTLVALLVNRKDMKLSKTGFIKVLFVHPVFYMEYIKIVAKAIFSKNNKKWEEIARVSADSIETIA